MKPNSTVDSDARKSRARVTVDVMSHCGRRYFLSWSMTSIR